MFEKLKQFFAPPVLNFRGKNDEYRAQVFKQIYGKPKAEELPTRKVG
jgi:hypothetical protein